MKLTELHAIVRRSEKDAWHGIEAPSVAEWKVETHNTDDGERTVATPLQHHTVYVLRDDVDITLAMGMPHLEEYHAPWLPNPTPFADEDISSVWVHLRYRGQVVDTWIMVLLDGARCATLAPKLVPGTFDDKTRTAEWALSREDREYSHLFASMLTPEGVTPVLRTLKLAE